MVQVEIHRRQKLSAAPFDNRNWKITASQSLEPENAVIERIFDLFHEVAENDDNVHQVGCVNSDFSVLEHVVFCRRLHNCRQMLQGPGPGNYDTLSWIGNTKLHNVSNLLYNRRYLETHNVRSCKFEHRKNSMERPKGRFGCFLETLDKGADAVVLYKC